METHSAIIVRLGGIRKVATGLRHANHTTVQGWHDRNNIPINHWADLIQFAASIDEPLTSSDLMPASIRTADEAAA